MSSQRFLITGVGGFVGRALARELTSRGDQVVGVGRSEYPDLNLDRLTKHQIDISKPGKELDQLMEGVDGVFHVAAKVDLWGEYEDFHKVNVTGKLPAIPA